MPIIRETKIDPELASKFKRFGACVAKEKEVWFIEGKKLNVAKVTKVLPGKIEVETGTGKRLLSPLDVFLVTTAKMKKGTVK